jgi:hypothetical protein
VEPNDTDKSGLAGRPVELTPALMREILADVEAMTSAGDLDLWASWVLRQLWKQRLALRCHNSVDWLLVRGSPVVELIAESAQGALGDHLA